MYPNNLRVGLVGWILGLLFQAHANQIIPLSIEQLAAKADQVVYGKVLSKTCLRNDRGEIYTRISLQVYESWKGPVVDRVVIVQAGGTLGDQRVEAQGQLEYTPGEIIVDCLRLNARGEGVSIGVCQGKFHVWTDGSSGEIRAASRFHGRGEGLHPASTPKPGEPAMALDALRTRIRGAAK